jgi:hypothetical protein
MIGTLAPAAVFMALVCSGEVQAKPVRSGCADHWQIDLDRDSFANNGAGKTFTPVDLAAFRVRIQAALRSAGANLCNGKRVTSLQAAAVRRVRVLSASGASEPHVYSAAKGTLNLEWVFAEEGLALPARTSLGGALICWANPADKMCSDQGD